MLERQGAVKTRRAGGLKTRTSESIGSGFLARALATLAGCVESLFLPFPACAGTELSCILCFDFLACVISGKN